VRFEWSLPSNGEGTIRAAWTSPCHARLVDMLCPRSLNTPSLVLTPGRHPKEGQDFDRAFI